MPVLQQQHPDILAYTRSMGLRSFLLNLVAEEQDQHAPASPVLHDGTAAEPGQQWISDKVGMLAQQLNCTSPDWDSLSRAVTLMLVNGEYDAARQGLQLLQKHFPEYRHWCELQLGRAESLLGNCKRAMDYYLAARVHGASPELMDELIWQTCNEHASRSSGHTEFAARLQDYLTLCPQGKYVGQAREKLQ